MNVFILILLIIVASFFALVANRFRVENEKLSLKNLKLVKANQMANKSLDRKSQFIKNSEYRYNEVVEQNKIFRQVLAKSPQKQRQAKNKIERARKQAKIAKQSRKINRKK